MALALVWGAALGGAALASENTPPGAAGSLHLLREFEKNWPKEWKSRRLYRNKTVYEKVIESGEQVLQATSERSASMLYREFEVEEPVVGRLTWRWRVDGSLAGNERETEKKGDDFAARVFVAFDGGLLKGGTRSICYVWAGNQPVGASFPNPYIKSVTQIVLRSGDARAGEWVLEERDVLADYERVFGEAAQEVNAVAVMVDTDQTKSSATAWFDDIVFVYERRSD